MISEKSPSISQSILINGGGIGGLTTALALAQKGIASQVLEQASEFQEVGAGLQVGPNAFRVFDQLGVTEAINALATFPESFTLMDALEARQIVQLPLGDGFRARFGFPYGLMHRADLHQVLLNACRRQTLIKLHTNSKCVSFMDTGNGVDVTLADGNLVSGSALVGADGLWSVVRQSIVGDGPPRLAGHICYRAIVPITQLPEDMRSNAMNLWVGPKMHMVLWPMRQGAYSNVTVVFHSDRFEEGWDTYGDPEELRERVANLDPKVRDFVMAIQDWRMYVLRDRDPIRDWSKGRVTLLGDAAHPMLQYLAQGACMAMEDAVSLADQVASHASDPAAAFKAYQQQRYLRTARVQLTARLYGHVYHAAGASADLRNEFLRTKTPAQIFESMAWIYE
ncbi:MAG: 3-hydroxybenzoate 6-monooxygenase [Limnohabitans sp.]|nr:3-hydroxybenzoate 6-monooxygenase [Limnohabitans sp.]